MVSFSCETCNDTIIKKKLDQHKQRCRSAVFTCIDCSTTFQGNDYRGHTQCITEDEKYQKALYKGKKGKQNAKNAESKLVKKQETLPEKKKTEKQDKPNTNSPLKTDTYVQNTPENLYKVVKRISKGEKLKTKDILKHLRVSSAKDGQLVVVWDK